MDNNIIVKINFGSLLWNIAVNIDIPTDADMEAMETNLVKTSKTINIPYESLWWTGSH